MLEYGFGILFGIYANIRLETIAKTGEKNFRLIFDSKLINMVYFECCFRFMHTPTPNTYTHRMGC